MNQGHFVDATGRPVFYGCRTDKARLEATHTWVDGGELKVGTVQIWDGAAWVVSTDLETEAAVLAKAQKLRKSDGGLIEVIDELVDLLVSKGVINLPDLSIGARKKLRDRADLRK